MQFKIIGEIEKMETIAVGRGIRELARLYETYGAGHWRKRKGVATVELAGGVIRVAEIHWYEANGIGRKEFKIKRFLG